MSNKQNNILVTGGAGFIGRWVVKALLDDTNNRVAIIDDLSNGSAENIAEFANEPRLIEFIHGKVENSKRIDSFFSKLKPSMCLHLAAQIIVQESIDDPVSTFRADVEGTFRLLELCRKYRTSLFFMSTCMVYDLAGADGAISERHPVVPRSPYAGAKLAGEHLAISYAYTYNLPVTVARPFNTYGPYQKSSGEGGVVSIFLSLRLQGEDLRIYGTGEQTRDLLYVGDCADFVLRCSTDKRAYGEIINAGTGKDVTINDLADIVVNMPGEVRKSKVKHVKHIHPQSEIMRLCCDSGKAKKLLGWKSRVPLRSGLKMTEEWIARNISEGLTTWS